MAERVELNVEVEPFVEVMVIKALWVTSVEVSTLLNILTVDP